ncbi:2-polyprenyl-6-methoxyphenol hydroxylase-like FAD-dependent oxidoreductase [Luteibacter sp. Sphag1AF]|uniref:FAD-dependent oxidoreductase n=1 Tax=Luteibacter sp. Sphag1AF TaxID=2587031 RepID=UPI0016156DC8|nr:NAD(P)/FAD-dependent oxidoreductase [Luteibacter sp. Sphag1AF]MBB3228226.1 2-polyprenyl-6-methoxyphenol hydroxylase-like FAD-dependent oxidoreductase [Luteibacter sp. Sphag1AF]
MLPLAESFSVHDVASFPLVWLSADQVTAGYAAQWKEEMDALIQCGRPFVVLHGAGHGDEQHEDRKERGIWLKRNKDALARCCPGIVSVEPDPIKRQAAKAMAIMAVKAFGIPAHVTATREEACDIAKQLLREAGVLRVAIVGAGPGGLCLAQGLRKHGMLFDVYERDAAPDSRTQGYRIRIDHTGQEALRACQSEADHDLFQRTCALPVAGTRVLDTQGNDVTDRWVDAWRKEPADADDADRSAHRQTMREVLMRGIDDHMHFAKAFARYEEHAEGVTVHFTDGTHVDVDVLVGADGVQSAVRRQRLPGHDPVDTDSVCIYGKTWPDAYSGCPATLKNSTSIVFADGMSVILDAMRFDASVRDNDLSRVDDYLYWAIIGTREAFGLPEGTPVSLRKDQLAALVHEATASWAPSVHGVFTHGDSSTLAMAAIHSAGGVPVWESSRVTVMGDAVHVMSPAGGLGANTALRDAQVLTECLALATPSTVPGATAMYEASMRRYATHALEASETSSRMLFGQIAAR